MPQQRRTRAARARAGHCGGGHLVCEEAGAKIATLRPGLTLVIQLSINGEPRGFPAPLDLARLLDELALAGKKVAIERNGEIVPRSRYAETPLADGDRLEIVVAVGGG
jgi:sulfur carrier protein